jgi:hypothetical protein
MGIKNGPFKTVKVVVFAPHLRIGMMVWLAALILGCSHGNDFKVPQADEIPDGPGVFTKGDDGAVLYDSAGSGMVKPASKPTTAQQTPNDTTHSRTTEFEEYEAYRQWKHWKDNPQNAEAYKEFLEWREWNRYRQWKDKQRAQP